MRELWSLLRCRGKHGGFFQFGATTDPESIKSWDKWSETSQKALVNIVVALAERWHWSRDETLRIPTRQRMLYLEAFEEIVDKEREAMRSNRS